MKKIACTFLSLCHYTTLKAFIGGSLIIGTASVAHADLRLCNQTSSKISVAIGHKKDGSWKTEGWWNFSPTDDDNACKVLLPGPLTSRFYYVYAMDITKGGEWGGKALLCTQQKEFTIEGIENCIPRGYEQTGFFEVDTSKQESWTIQLTDQDFSYTWTCIIFPRNAAKTV